MRGEFVEAIRTHQKFFDIDLPDDAISGLTRYFELVSKHNSILHLVAPVTPAEFATRHILESLTLLEFLSANARFADVGTGAGLPSIPCLIAKGDLKATLIESKDKKAAFLRAALTELGLSGKAKIISRQFEETVPGDAEFITCRAIDKFTEKLPRLIKWSKGRTLLLFGGPALRVEMENLGLEVREKLMPLSERRYLFVSGKKE